MRSIIQKYLNVQTEVKMPTPVRKQLPKDRTPGADFTPLDILRITSLEQLRAISDPLRLDILEIISREALTVKQMADKLKQPPTRLYYHVNELERGGFVTLVGTRVKSGIVEKYYRSASESIQVDRSLLNATAETGESLSLIISSVFDTTIADITRSYKAGRLQAVDDQTSPEGKLLMLTHDLCRLRREDIPLFIRKFRALLAEMDPKRKGKNLVTYGCTIAFYPHTAPDQDLNGKE
jgi:DNA-binding transcriptional ArsR family regulator